MIPTVTNNHLNDSSITSKNFKRHTDPPWLWTFVCIGSVSLHLLVFWLMRSSNEFKAWFPQSNQSSIPIDLIEIASEPKSQIKTQSTTPKIKPQSSFSTPPKSASVKLSNQDDADSSVNLPEQDKSEKPKVEKTEVEKTEVEKPEVEKPEVEKTEVEKPEVEKTEVEKTEVEKPPVRQQSYPTNPTPEPTSIIPESERPWNNRQEVKLGEGTLLRKDIPADSPTPTTEPSLTANRVGAITTVSPILKE